MSSNNKIAAVVALALGTLSLTACASPANYAADSCNAYDEVVTATNGSDIDAITTANATFAATLAVWQGEGGESSELYGKLTGYAGALEGFILTGSPETAKTYTDYKDAESATIEALCTDAKG
jgi:hypothetical protein